MNISLLTFAVISITCMVAMGYIIPYIVLGFYAIKRNTTVKSLNLLIKKYANVFDSFGVSKAEGWGCGIFAMVLYFLFPLMSVELSYNDKMAIFIIYLTILLGALLYINILLINSSIDIIDKKLSEQSIKI